jgi:hypothetical protein
VRRGSRFEMYYTGKGFRISFRKRLKAEGRLGRVFSSPSCVPPLQRGGKSKEATGKGREGFIL